MRGISGAFTANDLDEQRIRETLRLLEEALAQSDLLPAFDAIVRNDPDVFVISPPIGTDGQVQMSHRRDDGTTLLTTGFVDYLSTRDSGGVAGTAPAADHSTLS